MRVQERERERERGREKVKNGERKAAKVFRGGKTVHTQAGVTGGP